MRGQQKLKSLPKVTGCCKYTPAVSITYSNSFHSMYEGLEADCFLDCVLKDTSISGGSRGGGGVGFFSICLSV